MSCREIKNGSTKYCKNTSLEISLNMLEQINYVLIILFENNGGLELPFIHDNIFGYSIDYLKKM